jgi:hypothetical protein
MTDTSSKTRDNLTLLVKYFTLALVANFAIVWYGIYELRCLRHAEESMRVGEEKVLSSNAMNHEHIMEYLRRNGGISINNKGTVNIKQDQRNKKAK